MRREERTRLNNLRKTVSTDTVYVEVPMHFTVEGKQAIHELLTIEKGLVARRINWNPILKEYAILYSPVSDADKELHQETTDIETVMAGLKTTDIWWNGSSKKHDNSTDPTDTDSTDKKQEENETSNSSIIETMRADIIAHTERSAWSKGVTEYALELLDSLAEGIEGGYYYADDIAAPRVLEKICSMARQTGARIVGADAH